jgi:1-acyl-sn-glycerol-3-phosphate acyltransferase
MKKHKNKVGYSERWFKFIKPTLGKSLVNKYNVKFEYLDDVCELQPPYLVFPNHTTFWDPFIVNYGLPHRIHYLVSDANFVNPIFKMFLNSVGAIPKAKAVKDTEAMRKIVRAIKADRCIGVYPEGKRTWSGKTLPLFYSASKMVKAFKLPVVTPLVKGMFLSQPRWQNKSRFGEVRISYHIELTPEDIEKLSVDEIHERLTKVLAYNEFDFQREAMIEFKSSRPAEYLEQAIFICPKCKAIGNLHSDKRRFFCNTCGYEVFMNKYLFFETPGGKLYFDNIADWDDWQMPYLKSIVDKAYNSKDSLPIFADEHIKLKRSTPGLKKRNLKRFRDGNMYLYYDHILFISKKGEEFRFDLDKVRGINVQERERLEFYYNDTLHRISYKGKVSSLKWMRAVQFLHKHHGIIEEGSLEI